MAEMKISNTLVNDTSVGVIGYAEQLKDKLADYSQYEKLTAAIIQQYDLDTKMQDKLNNFFLHHYNEFHQFLEDKGVDGVIDTWRDVEEFLESISDEEGITFMNLIKDVQIKSGQLNIRFSEDEPGMLEAVTTSDTMMINNSQIDETGTINIVYNF